MNLTKKTLTGLLLAGLALVLVLGAIPAQAAPANLRPAITPGPLSHREELRATVHARAKLVHIELRIDNKKVQPWVKAHAGWKYSVRYPLTKLATGMHTAVLKAKDQKNRSSQRHWSFQKLTQLGLIADRTGILPGETVVLTGEGFTPGTAITIGMGAQNGGVGGNYGNATADTTGRFALQVTLDRYADGTPLHAGPITLLARNSDGSEKAAVELRVLPAPKLALDKSGIKPGEQVRLTGTGFSPNVAVSISLGGINTGAGGNYGSTVTDNTGAFALTVRPAQYPDGSALVAGTVLLVAHTGDSAEKAAAQLQILADPSITLNRNAIKAGEKVTVTGTGFTPGASVSIALGGVNTGAGGSYGAAVVNGNGRFSLEVLLDRFPNGSVLTPGTVILLAHTADFAEKASAQLQVQASPTLTASKTTVRVGETITLTGQGFTPGKTIAIRLAGINVGHGDQYGTVAVDANGRFTTPLTLARYPDGTPLPPGGITLAAFTADGEQALVSLQLVDTPAISLDKAVISAGDQVTISGQGFTPGATVIISMGPVNGGAGGNYGTAIVDTNGRFRLPVVLARYPDGSPLQPGTIVLLAHTADYSQQAAIPLRVVDRVPAAPTDLHITSVTRTATSAEPTTVGLQWRDNASNETGFRIQATFIRVNGGTDTQAWTVAANATSAKVSFTAGGINPVHTACFTVTAFNGQGDSSASNQACLAL